MSGMQKLLQAKEDVHRISRALWEVAAEVMKPERPPIRWEDLTEGTRAKHMEVVRRLLLSDVIRVGYVPTRTQSMEGQVTIDQAIEDSR